MVKTNPYDFRLFVKFYGKNLRKNLRKFYSVMKFYVNLRKFFFRLQTLKKRNIRVQFLYTCRKNFNDVHCNFVWTTRRYSNVRLHPEGEKASSSSASRDTTAATSTTIPSADERLEPTTPHSSAAHERKAEIQEEEDDYDDDDDSYPALIWRSSNRESASFISARHGRHNDPLESSPH